MTTVAARLERAWDTMTRLTARPRLAQAISLALIVISGVTMVALLGRGAVPNDGGGIDGYAYWNAGHQVLIGAPLYGGSSGDLASYLYPPLFAQLMAPFSLLPFVLFLWLWRAIEIACLRYVMGSWRAAGLSLLLWWPVFVELDIANVNLLIAAAVAATIRGDARALLPSALTKFASLAALPAALRSDRRGVLLGVAVASLACAFSVALAPATWADYLRFLGNAAQPVGTDWHNVGALIWTPLRLGLAVAVALAAWRWRRLAAVAVTLAMPVLWFHGLVVLLAAWARPGGGSGWDPARD